MENITQAGMIGPWQLGLLFIVGLAIIGIVLLILKAINRK